MSEAVAEASYRASRPGRFASAAQIACTFRRAHLFAPLLCPLAHMLPPPDGNASGLSPYDAASRDPAAGREGSLNQRGQRRQARHLSPEHMGTRCEPWMNRHALATLDRLVEPHHRGLEWSSGSSTLWNLLRLRDLHTVEHDGPWLAMVREKVATALPRKVASRWVARHVPCVELKPGGCHGMGIHNPSNPTNSYSEYVRTPASVYLPAIRATEPDFPGFDYVVVDGRSRAACMREATERPGLLNPAHGILVLDNANSPFHKTNVSKAWLHASFETEPTTRTNVWMVCTASDAHCMRAREELRGLRGCLVRKGA